MMMSQIFICLCSEVGYVYPLFGPVEYLSFSTLGKAKKKRVRKTKLPVEIGKGKHTKLQFKKLMYTTKLAESS